MNALDLIARWRLDELTAPTLPDELDAVARLRFAQAARLPPAERDHLIRLLNAPEPPIEAGGQDRRKGPPRWH
jgi:hypothetical protein